MGKYTQTACTQKNAITFLSNKFNLELGFTLLQCTDGKKAQEESYEMSSAAACQEKSLSVTATVFTEY